MGWIELHYWRDIIHLTILFALGAWLAFTVGNAQAHRRQALSKDIDNNTLAQQSTVVVFGFLLMIFAEFLIVIIAGIQLRE